MLVQKLRLQRGWSQEQLAELSGLSVRTIQRIERGQPASVETLKALGAVFEVDFSALKEPEMNTPTSPTVDSDEAIALAHVRKLKAFYLHVGEYAAVILFLAIMNYFISPRNPWALWAALPMCAALVFEGLRAFERIPFLTAHWERQQVEKYLGRKL